MSERQPECPLQTPCSRKVPYPEHLLSERGEQREDRDYLKGGTLTCPRCRATWPWCIPQTLRTKLNIWNMEHLETVGVKVLMNSKDSHLKDHSIHLVAQATMDLKFIPDSFLSFILPYRHAVPILASSTFYTQFQSVSLHLLCYYPRLAHHPL